MNKQEKFHISEKDRSKNMIVKSPNFSTLLPSIFNTIISFRNIKFYIDNVEIYHEKQSVLSLEKDVKYSNIEMVKNSDFVKVKETIKNRYLNVNYSLFFELKFGDIRRLRVVMGRMFENSSIFNNISFGNTFKKIRDDNLNLNNNNIDNNNEKDCMNNKTILEIRQLYCFLYWKNFLVYTFIISLIGRIGFKLKYKYLFFINVILYNMIKDKLATYVIYKYAYHYGYYLYLDRNIDDKFTNGSFNLMLKEENLTYKVYNKL